MVKLVISDTEGTTTVVPLVRDEISIGRREGNTIRLTERNVSRKHAQLRRVNGAYKLKDLDSYVGTLVNGARVEAEAEIHPGDTIEIGDYRIRVEREGEGQVAPPVEDEATRVTSVRAPSRLFVLGEPSPGAQFTLPEQGAVRVGRGEDAGIRIDHPSVSREHLEIERVGTGFRVRDLGSANGMRVGGQRLDEAVLGAGDVLELGTVFLRFVPPEEAYEFDPAEVARYQARPPRTALWAGVGGAVVALVVVIVLATSGGDDEVPAELAAAAPVAVAPEPAPAPEPAAVEPRAPADDGYDRHLADCRSALEAGRFVEAIAHSNSALGVRAGAADAERCRVEAQRGAEDEQAFVRGKAALDARDAEGAYDEFSALAPDSPFRGRPELTQALDALGAARIAKARAALPRDPNGAARAASSVLEVPDMPDARKIEAREVFERAQEEQAKAQASRATATRSAGGEARGGKSAMDAAGECLATGDNECVVRALKGRAKTAQELGLLIETYRAMGQVEEARKQMALYVKRFPSARRAEAYAKMLGREASLNAP
jgi:pSer/pThr/pTyr-binding forkhead associated (FHA) protein